MVFPLQRRRTSLVYHPKTQHLQLPNQIQAHIRTPQLSLIHIILLSLPQDKYARRNQMCIRFRIKCPNCKQIGDSLLKRNDYPYIEPCKSFRRPNTGSRPGCAGPGASKKVTREGLELCTDCKAGILGKQERVRFQKKKTPSSNDLDVMGVGGWC